MENIFKKYNVIGGNILITKNNQTIKNISYGYSDIKTQEKITDSTIYRIASISKLICAIGVYYLVSKNLVDLDKDISDYLGYKVSNPKYLNSKITLNNLLSHTATIKDTSYNIYNGTNIIKPLQELLSEDSFHDFDVSTKFSYSNFGYGIIACIIEKITNLRYPIFMKKHIFSPLKINPTYNVLETNNICCMYNDLNIYNKEYFEKYIYNEFPLGDNYRGVSGGLFCSNKDLITLLLLLTNKGVFQNKQLIKEEYVNKMYQINYSFDNLLLGSPVEIFKTGLLRGLMGGAYGLISLVLYNSFQNITTSFFINGFHKEKDFSILEEVRKYTTSFYEDKKQIIKITKNEILLESRKIIDNDILIDNYIKLLPFCDMLDIYLENVSSDYVSISNKLFKVKKINNFLYINLFESLKELNIFFTEEKDEKQNYNIRIYI